MKHKLLFIPLAFFALTSCEQDPIIESAVVNIDEPAATPSFTSANIYFTINFTPLEEIALTGELSADVYYSTMSVFDGDSNPSVKASIITTTTERSYVANLVDLEDASHYYYIIKVHNNVSSAVFGPYEFTTLSISSPTLGNTAVTQIGYNTACFSSSVATNGGADITEYGFCWSKSANPTLESNIGHISIAPESPFSHTPTDLIGGTEYHVRAYARNSKTIGYGEDVTFTTTAYSSPTVITNNISTSNISYTSATLSGSVTAAGSESIVNRGFYYSTNPNPSIIGQKVNASGTGLGTFNHTINGLQSGTTYYYCAYAKNSQNLEGLGEVKSFTTK